MQYLNERMSFTRIEECKRAIKIFPQAPYFKSGEPESPLLSQSQSQSNDKVNSSLHNSQTGMAFGSSRNSRNNRANQSTGSNLGFGNSQVSNQSNNRETGTMGSQRGMNQNSLGFGNSHLPAQRVNDFSKKEIKVEETGGNDIKAEMMRLQKLIDEKDDEYQNISNSNRLKKLNTRKELNSLRVQFNKLKNQL